MAKSNPVADIAAIGVAVVGIVVLGLALLVGGTFLTAWICDLSYSNIFEAQGIGPDISYWQMVGAVIAIRLLRGIQIDKTFKLNKQD